MPNDNIKTTIDDATLRMSRIISEVMHILPVGYLPDHTPETIPKRVSEILEDLGKYRAALENIADGSKHAKEIAQNALGYTDNEHYHIELLREENLNLKLELEKLQKEKLESILKSNTPQTYNERH